MRKLVLNTILALVAVVLTDRSKAQRKTSDLRLPNIVFIISDQHKLDETGAYGSKTAITPNIDKLARTGVTFTNFYTPAPVCAPARAALITGMYPYANGAIYHKAPVKMPNGKVKNLGAGLLRETGYHKQIITLAERLKKAGYRTAAPGKMHVHGELQENIDESYPMGNSMGFEESSVRYYTNFPGGHYSDIVGDDTYQRYRQFKKYKDVYTKGPMHLNAEYLPTLVINGEDNFDMVVARKTSEFIRTYSNTNDPFFIHVGFEKPHAPFTTAQKYLDLHDPADYKLPETVDTWYGKGKYPWVPNWIHNGIPQKNPQDAKNIMAAYNACITEVDDMVGRVINALKENGQYENTIIIYTTDHGEHLFEHGLRGKHCMYEEAVKIPFIVSYPKRFKQGVKVNTLASLIDVYPTLCELAEISVPEAVQGKSLLRVLEEGREIEGRTIFSEFRGANYQLLPGIRNVPSRMLREGTYKYVYTHGIIHQLYDLENDPNELKNLAFDDSYDELIKKLYFRTMADWRFQKYSTISSSINGDILEWQQQDAFKDYSILYAASNDPDQAEIIASDISAGTYNLKKEGFYWVLANPKYVKTSKRFGDVPVAVGEYTLKLPVSDPVKY